MNMLDTKTGVPQGSTLDPLLFAIIGESVSQKLYSPTNIVNKINFCRCSNCFHFTVREKIASQLISPILDYVSVVYQATSKTNLLPLNIVYNCLCKFALGCPYVTHHCTIYKTLNGPSPNMRKL